MSRGYRVPRYAFPQTDHSVAKYRRREAVENKIKLDHTLLDGFARRAQTVIKENYPVHLTDPRREKYPGQVALVNVRVLLALIEAARAGLSISQEIMEVESHDN